MNVISVDPGVTSSGFFVFEYGRERSVCLKRDVDDDRPTFSPNPQYWYLTRLRQRVSELSACSSMAIVESYPFTMDASRTAYAIEAGGVVREVLTAMHVPILVMPIPVWKAAVRLKLPKKGRSTGDDERYLSEVERRFDRRFGTTDEADAFLMYVAALAIWRGEYATEAAAR